MKKLFFMSILLFTSIELWSQIDSSTKVINIERHDTITLDEIDLFDTLIIRSYKGNVPFFRVDSNVTIDMLSYEIGHQSLLDFSEQLNKCELQYRVLAYSGYEKGGELSISTKAKKLILEISRLGIRYARIRIEVDSELSVLTLYGVKITKDLLEDLNQITQFESLEIGSGKMKISMKQIHKLELGYEIKILKR